jgi:UDP-glucuronate 4-epimerase
MKNILITGGAGFIGSNLTKNLLAYPGMRVTIVDNFDDYYSPKYKRKNISDLLRNNNFRIVEADIRRIEEAEIELKDSYDIVIHLAAKVSVRPSILYPAVYADVNVTGTQKMLDFAVKRKIPSFVFASSSSVYGVNPDVPWKEDANLIPISPYASTKLAGEQLGHLASQLHGIRFVALRFFTVYGPAQRPDLAIHKFFRNVLDNKPITIFGNGNTMRDYTYVGDIVKGIEAAVHYDKSNFEIFNLGNHVPVKLIELIRLIEEVCGKKANIEYLPEQPGEVPQTYADISKAENNLGYRPSTDLKTGLQMFYKWLKAQEETVSV